MIIAIAPRLRCHGVKVRWAAVRGRGRTWRWRHHPTTELNVENSLAMPPGDANSYYFALFDPNSTGTRSAPDPFPIRIVVNVRSTDRLTTKQHSRAISCGNAPARLLRTRVGPQPPPAAGPLASYPKVSDAMFEFYMLLTVFPVAQCLYEQGSRAPKLVMSYSLLVTLAAI